MNNGKGNTVRATTCRLLTRAVKEVHTRLLILILVMVLFFLLFKRSRVGICLELIICECLPKDLFLGYRIGRSKVFLNKAKGE